MVQNLMTLGVLKTSVRNSPEALEDAVWKCVKKYQAVVDVNTRKMLSAGVTQQEMAQLALANQELMRESQGLQFIHEHWHKGAVARDVRNGWTPALAHKRSVASLREQVMWKDRGFPGPPSFLHSLHFFWAWIAIMIVWVSGRILAV